MVREAKHEDLNAILELYLFLNEDSIPENQTVLDWLLEDINPEIRLRTLKEYEHLQGNDETVIACKNELLGSKVYERGLK